MDAARLAASEAVSRADRAAVSQWDPEAAVAIHDSLGRAYQEERAWRVFPWPMGGAAIASELYRQLASVDALYIGYKSNPQAFPDLLNGQLTFMVIDTINGKLQIDRGAMRGLAVTLPQREPRLAMVPSAGEAGLPDFQIWTWTGFYAPKGMPRELVARLNRDIVAACQDPQVLARLDTMGSTPSTTTPEEFAAFTRAEMTRWGDIIRRGNIKLE